MSPRAHEPNLLLSPEDEPRTRHARRLAVAARFGIDPDARSHAPLRALLASVAERVDQLLPPGAIALVRGPSGSGKSSVLRALSDRLRRRSRACIRPDPTPLLDRERRAVLDLFDGPLDPTMHALSRVGLAEPPLWLRPACRLSEGQRFRLRLAQALHALDRTEDATLVMDEFASPLDRVSAMTLCVATRRWLLSEGAHARLVLAGAHDDAAQWLRPALLVDLSPSFTIHGGFTIHTPRGETPR